MSLTVLDPGLLTLAVDFGRTGSRSLGVPVGGAADRTALALGNGLVGNPPDAVALELTLAGSTVRAEERTGCVVFGAPFSLTVSGRGPILAGTTFTLEPGEVLRIGGTPRGVRGYLCVPGGFHFPTILGSRSSLEPITASAVLKCSSSALRSRLLPFDSLEVPDPAVLRVLDGLQRDWFPDDAFFTRTFIVAPASNRMGLRLTGEPLVKTPGEMTSEPVAPGAVQVANDGLPIVLGIDGQTIGGYPKIAHVIRADLDVLARLRPGQGVRFQRVMLRDAEDAARERAAWLAVWSLRLKVG